VELPRARRGLRDLLISSFSVHDLKSFVMYSDTCGDAVFGSVDWSGSKRVIADRLVAALGEYAAISPKFFEELRNERPNRGSEIDLIRSWWVDVDVGRLAVIADCGQKRASMSASHRDRVCTPVVTSSRQHDRERCKGKRRLARLLDRTRYWRELIHACSHNDKHLGFVVHADLHQNVELFIARIRSYFRGATQRRHRVWTVVMQSDYQTVVGAEDWGRRIRETLGSLDLSFAEALEDASHYEAAMFVLTDACERPFKVSSPGSLSSVQKQALTDFLGTYLPQELVNAAPKNPLRFVVPVEYPRYSVEPTNEFFLQVCGVLQEARGIEYIPFPPLELPTWHDVWSSIKAELERGGIHVSTEIGRLCQTRFEALTGLRSCTFLQLADGLGELVDDARRGML